MTDPSSPTPTTPAAATRAEAAAALDDLARTRARTQQALLSAHVADHFIIWGLAWLVGFGLMAGSALSPAAIWGPVVAVGVLASALVGRRVRQKVDSPDTVRIFQLFAALAAFAVVWAVILHPFNEQHFGAYVATVFMFGYVAIGLWVGRFFVLLGCGVTALALVGVLLHPEWLDLLMAVGGGGSLVAAGIYMRQAWG